MDATLKGEVVEVEKKPYDFNGRTGTSYNVYLRTGSVRDGAQKIKVLPEQFGLFTVGQAVELECSVYARANDYGGQPTLDVRLSPEYDAASAAASALEPSSFGSHSY